METLAPGRTISHCKVCDQDFECNDILFPQSDGTVLHLKAGICNPCAEAKESAEARENETRMMLNKTWATRCPDEYKATDVSKIEPMTWNRCLDWYTSMQLNGRGLLLGGAPRKRKTRAAWMLVRDVHFKLRWRWSAWLWSGFCGDLQAAYSESAAEAENLIDSACVVPLLFLDDVAQDVPTPRVAETLKKIIEVRTSNRRPMIITMNSTGDNLERRYGDFGAQIRGRIRDYFDVVTFA